MHAKLLHCYIVTLFLGLGCGGEPALNEPPKCEERQVVTASKKPVLINIFLDNKKFLQDGFVINSLNSIWGEVGITVVQVSAMAEANIGMIYISGGCKKPVDTGRLQLGDWSNMDSIIVDSDCFDRTGYMGRFPAAVSHALGMLLGIEPYPDFCSDGVMSEHVGRMEGPMPTRLSAGDKEAFYHRSRFSVGWDYIRVCYEEPKWERGEYAPPDFRAVKFWAAPAFSAMPIESYLNRYFKVFGRSFVPSGKDEAEFAMKLWDSEYSGCSPAAITYNSLREIHLKPEHGCLELTPDSEWDATVVSHEAMHLFGVSHAPEWCGNAIMNPYVNAGPYFTPVDVKAWQERDISSSALE